MGMILTGIFIIEFFSSRSKNFTLSATMIIQTREKDEDDVERRKTTTKITPVVEVVTATKTTTITTRMKA